MNDLSSYMMWASMGNAYLSALTGMLEIILFITEIVVIIRIIFITLSLIANWVILEKAGEKGWKALIPVYSTYTQYKICKIEKLFWIEIAFILFELAMQLLHFNIISKLFNIVIVIFEQLIVKINLGKVFNKSFLFKLGLIFLPEIFSMILAFGDSKYMIQESEYDFHEIERH